MIDRRIKGGGRLSLLKIGHNSLHIWAFHKLQKSICSSRCLLHDDVIGVYVIIEMARQGRQTRFASVETKAVFLYDDQLDLFDQFDQIDPFAKRNKNDQVDQRTCSRTCFTSSWRSYDVINYFRVGNLT